MESDSDHFESADEDFDSDDEEASSELSQTKNLKNENQHCESQVSSQIKNMTIAERHEEIIPKDISQTKSLQNTPTKDDACSQMEVTNTQIHSTEKPKIEDALTIHEKTEDNDIVDVPKRKPRVIEKKERSQRTREPKIKLGVKLGTKIDKTKVDESIITETIKDIPTSCWEEDLDWTPVENEYSKTPNLYSKSDSSEKSYWENEADYMELPQKENIQNVLDNISTDDKPQSTSSWGNWGNWGVSTLLSTASLGVSTLTNSVSQGITTVLETGIGAPDPEELARIHGVEKQTKLDEPNKKLTEIDNEYQQIHRNSGFGLGNFVSGVTHITKLVESTGTKVLSGGLDTLEVIGKKTMEVLQEGDPGFKKKKALFGMDDDKPVLSQVLREAKEKAEEENKFLEERHFARKAHYETLFDDHQGLVHLEALEMLSKQCDIKLETRLESYSGKELTNMQETMAQIRELCELADEDEDSDVTDIEAIKMKVEKAVLELNVRITYEHLFKTWQEVDDWIQETNEFNEREIHLKAIETLAKLTAISVEQFHKSGELLLVKSRRSTVDEADSLVQLTSTLTSLIGMVAGKFSEKLNTLAETTTKADNINSLITNIFLEAANSSSYIQDAYQLLIPVLQVGAK